MTYDILRFLHVIGATVLLGTGAGIAFFMVISNRSGDPRLIAHVGGIVVLADTVFTATAALFQPVTGYLLAREAGWPVLSGWVGLSLALYIIVGAFWLPVVWMQYGAFGCPRGKSTAGGLSSSLSLVVCFWFSGICGSIGHHMADVD